MLEIYSGSLEYDDFFVMTHKELLLLRDTRIKRLDKRRKEEEARAKEEARRQRQVQG